jgi:hypothetical protein
MERLIRVQTFRGLRRQTKQGEFYASCASCRRRPHAPDLPLLPIDAAMPVLAVVAGLREELAPCFTANRL